MPGRFATEVVLTSRARASSPTRRLLTDGAERISSFSGAAQSWAGKWPLVSARVPETDRSARQVLRTRLSWAGFGSLAPGLRISPHLEREAEAVDALRTAGVSEDAHVFVATRSGLGDERGVLAAAWKLPAIEQHYEEFIEAFRSAKAADVLARQLQLVHAWRRFPSIDPSLPRELLPARWSGLQAARLFAQRNRRWSAAARRERVALNAGD